MTLTEAIGRFAGFLADYRRRHATVVTLVA